MNMGPLNHFSPRLLSIAERTLALVERAENDPALRDRIVREGVANIANGYGFHPVDDGFFPLW